jgi:hypothetical protein
MKNNSSKGAAAWCGCDYQFIMQVLLSFSAGSLVCISLVHLLAIAAPVVNAQQEYPVAYILFIGGIVISLASEQFGMAFANTSHKHPNNHTTVVDNSKKSQSVELTKSEIPPVKASDADGATVTGPTIAVQDQSSCDGHGHKDGGSTRAGQTNLGLHVHSHHHHGTLTEMKDRWSLIKAIIMEISIAGTCEPTGVMRPYALSYEVYIRYYFFSYLIPPISNMLHIQNLLTTPIFSISLST